MIKKIKEFLKENPRKIAENLTSWIGIIVGILGLITMYGVGIGLTPELVAEIMTITVVLNRISTYIRITYLKEQNTTPEEDNFVMV